MDNTSCDEWVICNEHCIDLLFCYCILVRTSISGVCYCMHSNVRVERYPNRILVELYIVKCLLKGFPNSLLVAL